MKRIIATTLTLIAVALAGCAEGPDDGLDVEPTDQPSAELTDDDVPVDGSERDWVECTERTHIKVVYLAGDDLSGDFTINVYSESSYQRENSSSPGIQVWGPERIAGTENGTLEEDIHGSAGTWWLEVHRSREHDGSFLARLTCA